MAKASVAGGRSGRLIRQVLNPFGSHSNRNKPRSRVFAPLYYQGVGSYKSMDESKHLVSL
jgi:hypothetical protein